MSKPKACRCCEGSGEEKDHAAIGAALRSDRKKRKVSMSKVAIRMGFSIPYLYDLEYGRRNWTDAKVTAYRKAIEKP
jgi:hypothetical protein